MSNDYNVDFINPEKVDKNLDFVFDILDQIENLTVEIEKEFATEVSLIFGKKFAEEMVKE
jgi:hypothetical protein